MMCNLGSGPINFAHFDGPAVFRDKARVETGASAPVKDATRSSKHGRAARRVVLCALWNIVPVSRSADARLQSRSLSKKLTKRSKRTKLVGPDPRQGAGLPNQNDLDEIWKSMFGEIERQQQAKWP